VLIFVCLPQPQRSMAPASTVKMHVFVISLNRTG
jgi:hypothetical protein